MYPTTLRDTRGLKRPEYPLPSHCWRCGRFGHGRREYPQRRCNACEVTWYAVLPGTDPAAPVNREGELRRLRSKYLPRAGAGALDNFDDFLDHGQVKLACPA